MGILRPIIGLPAMPWPMLWPRPIIPIWPMPAIGAGVLASAFFAALIIIGRRVVGRISGVILLCGYFTYIIYLFTYGSPNI